MKTLSLANHTARRQMYMYSEAKSWWTGQALPLVLLGTHEVVFDAVKLLPKAR